MASPSKKKPTTSWVLFGLGIFILLLIVAIAVEMLSLGNPYYAIAHITLFATALIFVALRLKECFQLAKGSQYTAKLTGITFFLVVGTIPIISHLSDVIQANDRNYIELALNICVYFSLYYALELVVVLLRKATADVASPGIVPSK